MSVLAIVVVVVGSVELEEPQEVNKIIAAISWKLLNNIFVIAICFVNVTVVVIECHLLEVSSRENSKYSLDKFEPQLYGLKNCFLGCPKILVCKLTEMWHFVLVQAP